MLFKIMHIEMSLNLIAEPPTRLDCESSDHPETHSNIHKQFHQNRPSRLGRVR